MARKLTRRQREEEARKKRVRVWMGGFIIVIMVLSTVGFIVNFYAPQNPANQGSFNYEQRDNRVFVQSGGEEIMFYALPQGIQVPNGTASLLQQAQVVVLAYDPSDQVNAPYVEQVRFDLSQQLSALTSPAELYNVSVTDFPVVSCAQASAQSPVVRFVNESMTSISRNGSCLTVGANQVGFLFARDALLYEYYGIV